MQQGHSSTQAPSGCGGGRHGGHDPPTACRLCDFRTTDFVVFVRRNCPDPRISHARTLAPVGSYSGSAATVPATQSPNTSTCDGGAGRGETPRAGRRRRSTGRPRCDRRTARDPTDRLAADADRLVAEHRPARVRQRQAGQPPRRGRAGRLEGVTPDEVTPCPSGRRSRARPRTASRRRDVRPPVAVALLGPQRVDRLVAAGQHPVRPPGRDQLGPQPWTPYSVGDVDLPAELADEGHARHPDRAPTRRSSRASSGTGSRRVQRLRRQRLQDVARRGPHSPKQVQRAGHVAQLHRPVARRVPADPGQVVHRRTPSRSRSGRSASSTWVTVTSHSMPPRALSIWV